jgi:uncharacterized protein (DUF58 family)
MQFSKWVTIVFGALCLVAVAGVLGAPQLYYMAAILLTLPFVSWLLGWYALSGLTFDRRLPAMAWEREEVVLQYTVRNSTRIARFFLSFQEELPAWFQSTDKRDPLFNVGAYETITIEHRYRMQRRGVYEAAEFSVTAMDPLGVFGFTQRLQAPAEMVVYPMPRPIPLLELAGSEKYGFQDFTTLALHGSSVDPDGVRLYSPGDPLRRVHWRQTARTGRLTVIEYDETQTIDVVIAIDLHRGTDIGKDGNTTLEYAVRIAASLCDAASRAGASVRMAAPAEDLPETMRQAVIAAGASTRGDLQMTRVLAALARVQAESSATLAATLEAHMYTFHPGSSIVVLTSRPEAALAQVMVQCRALGIRPMVVYIDPETFDGGRGSVKPDQLTSFQTELSSVGVPLFVVRHEADGQLAAEAQP